MRLLAHRCVRIVKPGIDLDSNCLEFNTIRLTEVTVSVLWVIRRGPRTSRSSILSSLPDGAGRRGLVPAIGPFVQKTPRPSPWSQDSRPLGPN